MFIKYKKIDSKSIIVDTRSKEEHLQGSITDVNIPIMNKDLHNKLKKAYPLALPIILYGLYKDREKIIKELMRLKNHNVVFSCSRGRLRSPIMCIFARILGIKSKVLLYGVKGVMKNENIF